MVHKLVHFIFSIVVPILPGIDQFIKIALELSFPVAPTEVRKPKGLFVFSFKAVGIRSRGP